MNRKPSSEESPKHEPDPGRHPDPGPQSRSLPRSRSLPQTHAQARVEDVLRKALLSLWGEEAQVLEPPEDDLFGEVLFDYWEGKASSEVRAAIDAKAASSDVFLQELTTIGAIVLERQGLTSQCVRLLTKRQKPSLSEQGQQLLEDSDWLRALVDDVVWARASREWTLPLVSQAVCAEVRLPEPEALAAKREQVGEQVLAQSQDHKRGVKLRLIQEDGSLILEVRASKAVFPNQVANVALVGENETRSTYVALEKQGKEWIGRHKLGHIYKVASNIGTHLVLLLALPKAQNEPAPARATLVRVRDKLLTLWRVEPTSPGWRQESLTVLLPSPALRGDEVEAEVQVVELPSIQIGLAPIEGDSHSVSVRLILQTKEAPAKPIVGATINWAAPEGKGWSDTTTEGGVAEFYELTPGEHTFEVEGYPQARLQVDVELSGASDPEMG